MKWLLNKALVSKSIILICIIAFCIFFFVRCINNSGKEVHANNNVFKGYSGSGVCVNCHKDIYEKHLLTGHHLTSAPANAKNILGSFSEDHNVFAFDPFVNITMERKDSGYYQAQYSNGIKVKEQKIDIIVGSGKKGQSYLSWMGKRLVQLPITYFTAAGQWSNSPGYIPHKPMFNRPITSRCLECHSTYFEKISDNNQRLEEFDYNKIIYAVDCEKCHGLAKAHVEFQTNNPSVKTAKHIINPEKLSRERLLDLCTLCHGGALTKTKPSFSFRAGDTLSNYFSLQTAMTNADNIDVHGNQFGLLAMSKCFKLSTLTCISCHNVHENEDGKIATFSQQCITCHNSSDGKECKLTATIGPSITQNCIDCHMPKQFSRAVAVYLQGDDVPTSALLRTHYIKIYPDETKKFLTRFMKNRAIKK